ncbi:MAG TPA: response regulator [Desulfurivibrio alkaliphilus]|uniref:histidine kinase n=1 Tax=Desulfurivibrio alkaliphilus TaxID=427923 RepID=A0A7C2TKS1_9BACT|nr:response regulator [Desulfurivibrio alkaliphilus]
MSPQTQDHQPPPGRPSKAATKRGQLLVVDDEPFVLQIISIQAKKLRYQVCTATSGREALEIIDGTGTTPARRFDLLLTDILMPGMDGLTFMAEARRRQPDLEVIVISGQHEIKTAVEAMRMGASNYLQKPFSRQELEIALDKGMEQVRLQRELRESQIKLASSTRKLDEYRRHLEQLVEERTAELAAANRKLRADIRARKLAEKEAEERRRQLIEADKMASLGILVAGVAHEINNPNNFIAMNAPILRRIWLDIQPILRDYRRAHGEFQMGGLPYSKMVGHVPELLEGITSGAERITKIVRNLNDYARQSAANMNQLFDLNQVVQAALTLLASPLKQATHHLEVDLAASLPPVRGNFQRAEQVAVNLLQNACQALAAPTAAIQVQTINEDGLVILQVRDQGRGIPARDLKQIQDPFFTTRRDSGGTGLGLSISAGIMEEHGGRLVFSSQPGQGTTARALFPAAS